MLHWDFIDKRQFSSCRSHVEVGAGYVFTMEFLTVSDFTSHISQGGARTSICPDRDDFGWCAPFVNTDKVGARRSVCPEIVDFVWCALPLGSGVSKGVRWLLMTSDRAKVEGARVLTTTEVPRAASGQVGSGSGGAQRFCSGSQ